MKPIMPDSVVQRSAKAIRAEVEKFNESQWKDVVRYTGLEEMIGLLPPEATLEEAGDDEIESLRRLSIQAMKKGMSGPSPNAQVIRAFHAYDEIREGEKQLQSASVEVVPASIPDDIAPMILKQMEELTRIANR